MSIAWAFFLVGLYIAVPIVLIRLPQWQGVHPVVRYPVGIVAGWFLVGLAGALVMAVVG